MTALYFIRAGEDGPIKIGKSINVASRLKSIQGGNHLPLTCIAHIPGRGWEELCWHKALPDYRMVGEWFEPIPQLLDAIEIALDYGPWWKALPIPKSFLEAGWGDVDESSRLDGWDEHMETELRRAFNDGRIFWMAARHGPPPEFRRNRKRYWAVNTAGMEEAA